MEEQMESPIEELDLEPVRKWLRTKVTDEELVEILLEPCNIEETPNKFDKRNE